jgi:hypothetical protein
MKNLRVSLDAPVFGMAENDQSRKYLIFQKSGSLATRKNIRAAQGGAKKLEHQVSLFLLL